MIMHEGIHMMHHQENAHQKHAYHRKPSHEPDSRLDAGFLLPFLRFRFPGCYAILSISAMNDGILHAQARRHAGYAHKCACLVYAHRRACLVYAHKRACLVYAHKCACLVAQDDRRNNYHPEEPAVCHPEEPTVSS